MSTRLPTGLVTFVFTDIEGSTRLIQRVGEARYAEVLDRHRRMISGAVEANSGVEVRSEGDGMFLAFAEGAGALKAALEAQLQLAGFAWPEDLPIRVRMGMHTGAATPASGDYTALAVNQAARICSAAHGGQVLVSADCAEGLTIPAGAALQSLGRHRLKDLGAPVELFQLCHPGLSAEFPPVSSLEVVANNLPVQTSTFVGRDQEVAMVRNLLSSSRVVTLLGPGGTGKTRLSYQAAAESVGQFDGGVWLAELANLAHPEEVPPSLAAAVGVRQESGRDLVETLVAHLRPRSALVLLDNCEHLIEGAAALVRALVEGCPRLRVLVTSREPLRVAGEVTYGVPGLGLAGAGPASDAVQLFLVRAAEVHPAFAPTPEEDKSISSICAQLDGLPLAIELAAARARSLTPSQIEHRLGGALDLLSKGKRGADSRQATLRGAIAWSEQLLTPPERVLFRRVAVFAGGWTLEASEEVCSDEVLPRGQVIGVLDSLVDKSLVDTAMSEDGSNRYRLLQTIREYAAERLEAAGEGDAVRDRHAAWYQVLATWVDPPGGGGRGSREEAMWFDRLETDHANLLAALDNLHRLGDPRELEIIAALGTFWYRRGAHWRTAQERLGRALATAPATSRVRRQVAHALGNVAYYLADYGQARASYEQALTMARDAGDQLLESVLVGNLGVVAHDRGDYIEAHARSEQALAIARSIGDRRLEGFWTGCLGETAGTLGDWSAARAYYEESVKIAREVGDREHEGLFIGGLGDLARRLGDYPAARAFYGEARQIAHELGSRHEGSWVGGIGEVAWAEGDSEGARAHLNEALGMARAHGDRQKAAEGLGCLAVVEATSGDPAQAREHLREAVAIARGVDSASLSVAIAEWAATLLAATGDPGTAVSLVAAARAHRVRSRMAAGPAEEARAETLLGTAKAALGDSEFDQAYSAGTSLTLADALDLVEERLSVTT